MFSLDGAAGYPLWPVVLAASVAWVGSCMVLMYCCVVDLTRQTQEEEKHHEHPIHALYRRNSKEDDGLTDILAEEDIDYHAMLDTGYHSPFGPPSSPPPHRHTHAATSTAPMASSSPRPILA